MAALFADLSMLEWVYLALFSIGLIYALFLAAFGFGHGSGLDHAADVGDVGHGVDLGDVGHGVDLDHGDTVSHHGPEVHASPWNPLVIASFVGGMGGFGILGTRLFGFQSFLSLLIALPAGLVLASIVFGLYYLLISQSGRSSAATWQDIRGAPGLVLTPIPATGVGEVTYVALGARYTSAARSVDGKAIPTGTRITVLDVEKTAVVVDVRYTED